MRFVNSFVSYLLFFLNKSENIEINEEMLQKINENITEIKKFSIYFDPNILEEQKEEKKNFLETSNEKYNIGNILYWENNYIMIGIPFGLDVIDLKEEKKICTINLDDNGFNNIIYNISEKIDDKEYGSCFIVRDYNNIIKYIRPSTINEESHGYRIIKSTEYFDDIDE